MLVFLILAIVISGSLRRMFWMPYGGFYRRPFFGPWYGPRGPMHHGPMGGPMGGPGGHMGGPRR